MIYLLRSGPFHKIGYTGASTPEYRISGLQVGNPVAIELVAYWDGNEQVERSLHRRFDHCRTRGEWFDMSAADLSALRREMAAYVPDALQGLRRARPPDPLCLPDLPFAAGARFPIEATHLVSCSHCGADLHFVGTLNYLVCEPCDRKIPMGTIISSGDRRVAVEAAMHRHSLATY